MAANTAVDVLMPQMGVSVSEGTITKWFKLEGEPVEADEPLLEISTDKVDTEVPSPASGTVTQILVHEGETVDVGTKLAVIGGNGTTAAAPVETPPEPAVQPAAEETTAAVSEPAALPAPEPAGPPAAGTAPGEGNGGRQFVSPVVARIAAEHGVDPTQVAGTGRGGRVTKSDILAFIEAAPEAPTVPEAPAPPVPAAPPPPPPQPQAPARPAPLQAGELEPQVGETFEPVTAMRRGIADHMRRSVDTAAHVTSAIEVDMSKVVAIRSQLKDEYRRSYGVSLTYLAFIARATIETLRDWPWINGELRGDKIVTKKHVNLGFAVALEGGQGLIVPVVKNAQDLNLLGLARAIADVADRARTKKLTPDDVQGGTFTITNPGGYGTFHGTPIINQPQSGILGTYALVKRPWVIEDELGQDVIAIRPIMNVTLTYDHRLIDGAYAAQFLRDLRDKLESWGESDY